MGKESVITVFREMRRSKQALSERACEEILARNTSGTLAVHGDDGYPYAVPLNYLYMDGCLWFHCARAGHKWDAVIRDEKVSFCVIDYERTVPERFTTYYRSVVIFGRARIVTDPDECRRAITRLADRFSPEESPLARDREIAQSWDHIGILCVRIDCMTGKEAIELVRMRRQEREGNE